MSPIDTSKYPPNSGEGLGIVLPMECAVGTEFPVFIVPVFTDNAVWFGVCGLVVSAGEKAMWAPGTLVTELFPSWRVETSGGGSCALRRGEEAPEAMSNNGEESTICDPPGEGKEGFKRFWGLNGSASSFGKTLFVGASISLSCEDPREIDRVFDAVLVFLETATFGSIALSENISYPVSSICCLSTTLEFFSFGLS